MSVRYIPRFITQYSWQETIPVFRYAIGSTLILAIAAGSAHTLAYITPVLALSFLAPGTPPLTLKGGISFISILVVACFLGFTFGKIFLEFPLVFAPILALALLHIFYSGTLNPLFRVWLILALLLIPFISTYSYKLSATVAISLVTNGLLAILLVWLVFFIFPYHTPQAPTSSKTSGEAPFARTRFYSALRTLIVVFPVVLLYYIFQLSSSVLILIFVAILSMNPETANSKVGKLMILANLAGGIASIIAYNLLVIVPNFLFFLLITLVAGLYFGSKVHSGKPTAPLFGTAFSTFLLILGSVTTSEADAGEKVWTRIIQIGAAVTYVVLAYNLVNRIIKPEKSTSN